MADAATSTPNFAPDAHYSKQMQFFSKLIDVFSPPSESNLTRLRVCLLASSVDNSSTTPIIYTRIPFDAYTQQDDLRRAIEKDNVTTSPISYPLTVALNIIATLHNETSGWARPDAEQIMIIVVDGGRPFQITKMDSELLVTFNTTKVRVVFILIGYESGINLQTVFPQNNYIKVQSYEVLNAMQSIPVNLCAFCYADWVQSVDEEHDISVKRVSCYRLFMEDDDLNWLESNEKCHAWSAGLVSIESEKELSFLKGVLPMMIQERLNTTNETSDYVNVYIGLTRTKALGQRFRWMNTMPLILTHWGEGQPNSGSIESCVAWNFSTNSFLGKDGSVEDISGADISLNNNVGYTSSFTVDNLWSSVGCGFNNGRFYLCESENKLFNHVPTLKTVSIEAPNSTSLEAAVSRSELALHRGSNSFVSLSALQITKDSFINYYSTFAQHKINKTVSLASITMYECMDASVTSIPYALVCDFERHCLNSIDESYCRFRECDSIMEMKCTSGQCVDASSLCDLYSDCLDGSDEADCTVCPHGRCPDGRCAPYHWFGDGEVDCSSCTNQGGIEAEMTAVTVNDIDQCVFTCNRTQCVYKYMLNDGYVDCQGPEGPIDETIGLLKSVSCYSDLEPPITQYTNWAPECVYIKDRYGEPLGCRNMKHLRNCHHYICPEGYIKCPRSYCIPVHYFQNKEFDCPRGEDELDLQIYCPGYFVCASSSICLHPDHVCDGYMHCPQGDDELNCLVTCRDGFQCLAGAVILDGYDVSVPLTDFKFVDSRTRYLDVSGVNISTVFPAFPRGHFYNLVTAKFSGCSITHIDATPSSQNQLRSMLWIDLSYNVIQSVSVTSIFRYMIGLRTVNLSHNPYLTNMHNDAFSTYSTESAIVEIDLSYTGLTTINSALFVPLTNLERLFLRNNPLTEIRGDMFPAGFVLQQLDLRGIVIQHIYANMFTNVIIKQSLFTDTFKLCCPQLHNKATPSNACKAPRDPFSSCADLISEQILRILLWVNGFLALVGNIFVIIYRLLFEKKILTMAYGHFVTHLSFSDLLMGIYLIIIASADTLYRGSYVWDELQWRNSAACKVSGFLSTLSNEASTIFITLITLDRFLVIRFPFGQLKITGKFINIFCVLSWAIGFMVATVPLLPPFDHWTIYSSNGMCLGLPLTNRRQPGWQFSTAIFIFLNFFLFMFIAIGQVAIYRTMSDTRIDQGSVTNASNRRAQDLAIAKHLSLIAITDFLCWSPVGVIGLLALDGHDIGMEAYAWLAVLVLPVNSALNPLLYTIPAVMKKFRLFKADTSCYITKNS